VVYAAVTALAKDQVETYLEQVGALATWKVRSAATPLSASDISAAFGHADPVDTGWVRELDDPDVYTTQTTRIRIAKDIPTTSQADDAGQMVTGSTVGYCSADKAVAVGDALVIASLNWLVIGSRLTSPAIYRELTLRQE